MFKVYKKFGNFFIIENDTTVAMCTQSAWAKRICAALRDKGVGNSTQQPHAACPEGETGRSCETCNYWKDGMCWGESCTDFSEWEQRPASA